MSETPQQLEKFGYKIGNSNQTTGVNPPTQAGSDSNSGSTTNESTVPIKPQPGTNPPSGGGNVQ